jgi:hypothetical protein
MFWIFFPAARDVFHKLRHLMMQILPISFDQILNSRRFNAVSTKKKMFTATDQLKIT